MLTVALSLTFVAEGQNGLKLRLSGNTTRFMSEPQGTEINYYKVENFLSSGIPYTDFTDKALLGVEAEIMTSLSDKVWLGFEVSKANFSGENDSPSLFNFQFTEYLELMSLDTLLEFPTRWINNHPLTYNTSLVNLSGTFRIYPLSGTIFRPFVKFTAGLSLISTELRLKLPELWYADVADNENDKPLLPVLFSRGTDSSEKGIFPAFTAGAGLGFEFQITPKIAAYADANLMMVNADITDGKPNWDYNAETGKLVHFNTRGNIRKIGFGLVYTLGENMPVMGSGSSGKGKGRAGRQHPYLPFYEIID